MNARLILLSVLLLAFLGRGLPAGAQTVIFFDTFTEPGGSPVPLASHTPDTGTSWTESVDTCTLVYQADNATDDLRSNANGTDCRMIYTVLPQPTSPDVDVEWTLNAVAGTSTQTNHLIARYQDTTHFYALQVNSQVAGSTNLRILLANGTVPTTATGDLGGATVTYAVGDILRLRLRGDQLTAFQCNPTCAAVIGPVTNATIASAGRAGLGGGAIRLSGDDIGAGAHFDNFTVTEFVGGPHTLVNSWPLKSLVNGGLAQ